MINSEATVWKTKARNGMMVWHISTFAPKQCLTKSHTIVLWLASTHCLYMIVNNAILTVGKHLWWMRRCDIQPSQWSWDLYYTRLFGVIFVVFGSFPVNSGSLIWCRQPNYLINAKVRVVNIIPGYGNHGAHICFKQLVDWQINVQHILLILLHLKWFAKHQTLDPPFSSQTW